MFAEIISASNVIELIEEETADGGQSHKVLFRVLDKKRWAGLLTLMFRECQEEEGFGLSVRIEYFWDQEHDALTFCWVLLVWGDLEDALDTLTPHLSKKAGPPKPPPSIETVSVLKGSNQVIISRSAESTSDGNVRQKTVIALPHRSAPVRNRKLNKTKKIGDRGRGAFVEGISGDDGGDPRSQEE
jgi:hypothetical protein